MLDDAERFVYHYTRPNTATEHILPSRQLRLSPFGALNDPFEYREFTLNYSSRRTGALDAIPRHLERTLAERLKERWRVGCFVADSEEACLTAEREKRLGYLDPIRALYERGHSRPRMWAQYADDHRGICLVFLRTDLEKAVEAAAARYAMRVYHGRVTYADVRAQSLRPGPFMFPIDEVDVFGLEGAIDRHIERWWRGLFLTKSPDWASEREYRWLLSGSGPKELFVDISGALAGIVLGDRSSARVKQRVAEFAARWDIEIASMDWRNGVPRLQPTLPKLI